jgi:predicted Zn-dependent protease with MMP-like domain
MHPDPTLPGVVDVPAERFEELVAEALDGIPLELGRLMDNVAVFVREGSPGSGLLGRYEGIPLTKRDRGYEGMVMPDRITIFRQPILARCRTEADVVRQVRITVVHEVGHHFGIDDARLHELGWA